MSKAFIPYGRQQISADDIDAVKAVLESDFLTQGPVVGQFEQAVARRCQAQYAVAVNSATSALHIACLALGLQPGGLLWTTPNTFVASANCARYCGADVDFVDIDTHTYCLCPKALAAKLKHARHNALPLPDIVVVVHFAGQSADMRVFAALASEFGFRLIEDASHAVGGQYRSQPVGSGLYSDATVFSFHPVKVMTSGEGGMVLCNDEQLAADLQALRSHGITRPQSHTEQAVREPWLYEQHQLGFNYRMTDLCAALGLSQLQQLDAFIARRQALAQRYLTLLHDLPLELPYQAEYSASALHLFPVLVGSAFDDAQTLKAIRLELYRFMQAERIGVNVHYIPVHTQPYYRARGFTDGDYPVAEHYYCRTLTLPLFASMSEAEQDRVADVLTAFFEQCGLAARNVA